MRKLFPIMLVLAMYPTISLARDFDLTGYQGEDGAITTLYYGDTVDPYFATKALLAAQDGGLDISKPAKAWIKWAMSTQGPDGLFDRYSRNGAGNWQRYASADADDAMLALWLELLYRQAPKTGLPKEWKESARKAEAQLQAIYDPELGIYHISKALPVGLFMDNVEIYSAYKNIAHNQKRIGVQSDAYTQNATRLNKDILEVFHQPATGKFLVSTQPRSEEAFYPDQVAQIFPLLYRLKIPENARDTYRNWIAANGKEWLKQRNGDYPWGLIAIIALNMNDAGSAACWQNSSEPMRYGPHWNVLEEAASQHVKWRLSKRKELGVPCVGKDLL
jgi:hypothetical protein